ncbi:hypothetical protein AB1N83_013274, partial [Pleurotus pulmonarius]
APPIRPSSTAMTRTCPNPS